MEIKEVEQNPKTLTVWVARMLLENFFLDCLCRRRVWLFICSNIHIQQNIFIHIQGIYLHIQENYFHIQPKLFQPNLVRKFALYS